MVHMVQWLAVADGRERPGSLFKYADSNIHERSKGGEI
jgi:hypothetical protein